MNDYKIRNVSILLAALIYSVFRISVLEDLLPCLSLQQKVNSGLRVIISAIGIVILYKLISLFLFLALYKKIFGYLAL